MNCIYILNQRLIAQILILSILLQSCSNTSIIPTIDKSAEPPNINYLPTSKDNITAHLSVTVSATDLGVKDQPYLNFAIDITNHPTLHTERKKTAFDLSTEISSQLLKNIRVESENNNHTSPQQESESVCSTKRTHRSTYTYSMIEEPYLLHSSKYLTVSQNQAKEQRNNQEIDDDQKVLENMQQDDRESLLIVTETAIENKKEQQLMRQTFTAAGGYKVTFEKVEGSCLANIWSCWPIKTKHIINVPTYIQPGMRLIRLLEMNEFWQRRYIHLIFANNDKKQPPLGVYVGYMGLQGGGNGYSLPTNKVLRDEEWDSWVCAHIEKIGGNSINNFPVLPQNDSEEASKKEENIQREGTHNLDSVSTTEEAPQEICKDIQRKEAENKYLEQLDKEKLPGQLEKQPQANISIAYEQEPTGAKTRESKGKEKIPVHEEEQELELIEEDDITEVDVAVTLENVTEQVKYYVDALEKDILDLSIQKEVGIQLIKGVETLKKQEKEAYRLCWRLHNYHSSGMSGYVMQHIIAEIQQHKANSKMLRSLRKKLKSVADLTPEELVSCKLKLKPATEESDDYYQTDSSDEEADLGRSDIAFRKGIVKGIGKALEKAPARFWKEFKCSLKNPISTIEDWVELLKLIPELPDAIKALLDYLSDIEGNEELKGEEIGYFIAEQVIHLLSPRKRKKLLSVLKKTNNLKKLSKAAKIIGQEKDQSSNSGKSFKNFRKSNN
jgi:hypothetical protein